MGRQRGFRDRTDRRNLPWIFRRAGCHTVSISTFAERHSAWWFNSGFKEMHNVGGGGCERADEVTPVALDWIARNARNDNWFLHVHYWDPHTIYKAPLEFGQPFAAEPLPTWITPEILARHQQCVGPHGAQEINMYDDQPQPGYPRHVSAIRTPEDLRRHLDGYDTCIRYVDEHVGRILEALKAQGVDGELAVILSSDHGENQGELGIYAEHGTADQATCRIPMILRWPGGARGVDRGLRYHLDFLPTLAELLGQEPAPGWDGQSYAQVLRTGAGPGRDYLVLSQCAHVCQRSVRFEDWLYLRTWHDGFHLFPPEMLFDLARDPYEQHDLAPTRPEICAQAARLYACWLDRNLANLPEGYTADPLQTVLSEGGPHHCRGRLQAYLPHLERTGRGWAVAELLRRHPQERNGTAASSSR